MSSPLVPSKAQKSRKEKEKEKEKEREREKERKGSSVPTERLKTVVRRLPPNLPEDIFWQSVQSWVTNDTALWKVYYPGKLRKKLNKENIPSRAYIAFKNEEQLALFSKEYDGHVFRDKAGVESQAVVEFAPYQKVPSEKRKPDTRNATIEKDEDYISFIEALKASENAEPIPLETLIASSQPPPPPKTTPLLEALKAEKSANRDKEAILRNHAHYNQIITRKEDKKKGATAPPQVSKQTSEAPTGGKKASKKGQAVNGVSSSAAPQNGKNAAPSTSRNVATNVPGPNAATSSKPPKGPKPPRAPPANKAFGEVKGQQGNKNDEESSRAPVAQVSIAVPPTPPADGVAPAPAPPRRSRPVIGLASRHFEAALSGVAGLANAATERKKREKEREAQAAAAPSTSASSSATQAPAGVTATFARIDGSDDEKSGPSTPVLPTSPKKKTRRGVRRHHHGDGDAEGTSAPVKVPSILQRADAAPTILQKDGPATSNSVLPTPAILTASSSVNAANSTRGGGRRGRGGGGRGGGRGGSPSAPRGG